MSGRSKSYMEGLYASLQDNVEAASYLQAAIEESPTDFLVALKNVLDARNIAAVARAGELDRVHIYRMLSKGGNPTLKSLGKILHALGLKLAISAQEQPIAPPTRHIFRVAWKVGAMRGQHTKSYGGCYNVARPYEGAPVHGVLGSEEFLSAAADPLYDKLPQPAFLAVCDETCEMAY